MNRHDAHTTRHRLKRRLYLSVPAVMALGAIAACTPAQEQEAANAWGIFLQMLWSWVFTGQFVLSVAG
ncbi:MAG TPA: hypothetical protein VJM33_15390 [Microthrixaceae bacterium]|nr:hypothetical protein [Microthrixaceae bacterium]